MALSQKTTLDYATEQILDLASVQVQPHMLLHFPPSAACSQFESTTRASHTIGHSIISASTFTDEKRSHKELCAKKDTQITKNSRNLCHLSPIILLITSHCEGLPLSTGSLIIQCICPHFPQPNQ